MLVFLLAHRILLNLKRLELCLQVLDGPLTFDVFGESAEFRGGPRDRHLELLLHFPGPHRVANRLFYSKFSSHVRDRATVNLVVELRRQLLLFV